MLISNYYRVYLIHAGSVVEAEIRTTVVNDLKAHWTGEPHRALANKIIDQFDASSSIQAGNHVTLVNLKLAIPARVARLALTLVPIYLIGTPHSVVDNTFIVNAVVRDSFTVFASKTRHTEASVVSNPTLENVDTAIILLVTIIV